MYLKKSFTNKMCTLDLLEKILNGKWKIQLMWWINEGYLRPSELQRKIPNASKTSLYIQLKELEDHELINRKIYPIIPPKVEYRLSEFGNSLIPAILKLGTWGVKNQLLLTKHNDRKSNN